ncbi:hypothetical protein VTN00DRAFT_279 [Thermoascus crustaceus]|uniref:uncharacterized protein n=1 Tax=Thermoascus crustaceus TaxID=5088 RepID=UPI0037448BB6
MAVSQFVFIEVKRETGVASERLDFIAQVIAECDAMAERALKTATSAWNQYDNGDLEESKMSAQTALQFLSASVESAPFEKPVTFPGFTEDMVNE